MEYVSVMRRYEWWVIPFLDPSEALNLHSIYHQHLRSSHVRNPPCETVAQNVILDSTQPLQSECETGIVHKSDNFRTHSAFFGLHGHLNSTARTSTTTCVTEEPLLNWDRMPLQISSRDGLTRHRINEMLLAAFSLLPSPLSLLPSLSLSLFLLILLPCQECPSWPDWSCFDNFFLLWDWHWWHEGHRTSTWQEAGHMIRTLQNLLSRAGKVALMVYPGHKFVLFSFVFWEEQRTVRVLARTDVKDHPG